MRLPSTRRGIELGASQFVRLEKTCSHPDLDDWAIGPGFGGRVILIVEYMGRVCLFVCLLAGWLAFYLEFPSKVG